MTKRNRWTYYFPDEKVDFLNEWFEAQSPRKVGGSLTFILEYCVSKFGMVNFSDPKVQFQMMSELYQNGANPVQLGSPIGFKTDKQEQIKQDATTVSQGIDEPIEVEKTEEKDLEIEKFKGNIFVR